MYGDIMEPLMTQLLVYRQKIEDGTFTPDDLAALKNTTYSYKAYMKQLQMTSYSITDIKKENGNFIVTADNV
jgi:hypothetical protein